MRRSRLAVLPAAALLLSCEGATDAENQALVDYLLNFCDTPPAWVGIQAGTSGPWTQVTLDANNKATVQVPPKFGFAVVQQFGSIYYTSVYFTTRTESPPDAGTCEQSTGTKTVNGSIAAMTSGQEAQITLDTRSAYLFAGGATTFQLTALRDGARDLIAQRRVSSTVLADKIIVRRAQDITAGATMTQLNFGGTEAVNPGSATLTVSGLTGTDARANYTRFYTANGHFSFFNSPTTSTNGTMYGLPAASALSTDMHVMTVYSNYASNTGQRGVDLYKRNLADASVTMGPVLSTPTVTVVSTTPKRLRLQLPSQTDYNGLVEFGQFAGSGSTFRQLYVVMTAGYVGSTPATWDINPPDFAPVSGFPTAALLPNAAADWWIFAQNDAPGYFKNQADHTDGDIEKWVYQESTSALLMAPPAMASLEQSNGLARTRRAMVQAAMARTSTR